MKIRMPIAIIICSMLLFCGCATFIGYGIGAASDATSQKQSRIAMGGLLSLEKGTVITAFLVDSSETAGQYLGFSGARPDIAKSSGDIELDSISLPFYREAMIVRDTAGNETCCQFSGFYYHKDNDKWLPRISAITDTADLQLDLYSINVIINSRDVIIERATMIRSYSAVGIEPGSSIIIQGELNTITIPITRIDHIETSTEGHAAERGLIFGAITDVSIYLFVRYLFSGFAHLR